MTYNSKDYQNYVEKIEKFKTLDWVKNHLHFKEKPNFWTILEYGEYRGSQERSAHETRSSRMIRWLMDANETHNLGNIFAHKLLQLIGVDYEYHPHKNKSIKATAEDMDIDIFYKDLAQKVCLAIELKQYAKEGQSTGFESQLDKYETLVEERLKKRAEEIHPYYIYLTPLKEDPSNENWYPVSYHELIDIIDQVYSEYLEPSEAIYVEDTKKIVSDFRDDLQRTLDFLERDHTSISNALTDEEKKLTLILAEEIEHETDTKHLDKLLEVDQDENSDIKDLILIIKDYIFAQNHHPNEGVRILIRKIYNYLSGEKILDTDLNAEYKAKETVTTLKQSLIDSYNLQFATVELTRGKGQGLFIYRKDRKYRIYLSGDTYGSFPNDGIQLLEVPNKGNNYVSKSIARGQFKVDDELILKDDIIDQDGNEIDIDQLMEQYIMKVIKELNDRVA